jgi:hypothetical protein
VIVLHYERALSACVILAWLAPLTASAQDDPGPGGPKDAEAEQSEAPPPQAPPEEPSPYRNPQGSLIISPVLAITPWWPSARRSVTRSSPA